MESSVKKSYERVVQSDGSVVIKYKGRRADAHQITNGLALLAVPLLFGALMVMVAVFALTKSVEAAVIGAVAFLFFVVRFIIARREYTLTLMREGVIFPRSSWGSATHQLRYEDISSVGVNRKSVSHNGQYVESCSVYAFAGGSEVQLTRFVTQSLASAISDEVIGAMNSSTAAVA